MSINQVSTHLRVGGEKVFKEKEGRAVSSDTSLRARG